MSIYPYGGIQRVLQLRPPTRTILLTFGTQTRTITRLLSGMPIPVNNHPNGTNLALRDPQSKALEIERSQNLKPKVPLEDLVFGHTFTDHMLTCEWSASSGWERPRIVPYADVSLAPSASVFHYGTACFEGLKAYRDAEGAIRLFRPDLNMNRLVNSSRRLALPDFEPSELLDLIKKLILLERDWIPLKPGYSLYLRPVIIGTGNSLGVAPAMRALLYVICSPVGPLYRTGFNAVKLYAEDRFVRSWPGGTGSYKVGAYAARPEYVGLLIDCFCRNYAGSILPQAQLGPSGYQGILWLFGPDHEITEVGAMNCFIYWINEEGKRELVTAPLTDGLILPGVTRDSILQITRSWGEFDVSERTITMNEFLTAHGEKRLLEMFGSGTAAVISPIQAVNYKGKDWNIPLDPADPESQAGPLARRLWEAITLIQYGQVPHEWSMVIS